MSGQSDRPPLLYGIVSSSTIYPRIWRKETKFSLGKAMRSYSVGRRVEKGKITIEGNIKDSFRIGRCEG